MKIPQIISLTLKGCGYLSGYGSHPGTLLIIILLFLGGFAGIEKGWMGFLIGVGVMALFFLPFYFFGAYSRAKEYYSKQI